MKTWVQLTAEVAHNVYCVPFDIASDPQNRFFGLAQATSIHYMDSSWPLLALLSHPEAPSVTTIQIYSADIDEMIADFNPLTATLSKYLVLDAALTQGLVQILQEHASQLSIETTNLTRRITLLNAVDLQAFRINQSVPGIESIYYQQTAQLLPTPHDTVTLIELSNSLFEKSKSLFVEIHRFAFHSLINPTFDPSDDSLAQIDLDRRGIHEFTAILESCLTTANHQTQK